MTDFTADLERELVAAARRRSGRRLRRMVPRPRLAAVVTVAALFALVLAAVAIVRGLEPAQTGDEPPAPPPRPGVTLALPAAQAAKPCPGVEQRVMAGEAPQGVDLSIFTRPQTDGDALPSPPGGDSYTWITLGTIYPEGSRRAGREQFDAELRLVAGAEPRQGGECEGELEADLGACLVVGHGRPVIKCFPDAEVDAGRALAVTGLGIVHGIVPDGIASATLRWDGGAHTAVVRDNVLEAHVPLAAGDTVRVELQPSDDCRPDSELLDAVPALRDARLDTLPTADGGRWQWGRRIGGDELDVWVIAPCEEADSVCVVAIYDERGISQQCGTAAQIRENGMWAPMPVGGRLGVAGLAPHGASRADVILDGRVYREVTTSGGVFATILPLDYGSSIDPGEPRLLERLELRFR